MIADKLNEVEKIFAGKFIEQIFFERGLGLVPAWFTIALKDTNNIFHLEIESNFRILGLTENILSFEDLFLDHSMHEISKRRYQSQKTIEKTYLDITLMRANQIFNGKKISHAKLYPYGDLELKINKLGKFHIINDSHESEATIFRLIDVKQNKSILELKLIDGIPNLLEIKN